MREILIYEPELDHVGLLNTLTSGFLSASTGSFLFALGLYTNSLMQPELPAKAQALLEFGIPAGIVVGVICGLAAYLSHRSKSSLVAEMKRNAVDIAQPAQQPAQQVALPIEQVINLSTPDKGEAQP